MLHGYVGYALDVCMTIDEANCDWTWLLAGSVVGVLLLISGVVLCHVYCTHLP